MHINFYLAAQGGGGGGLNPLNPPPPRRSATAEYTNTKYMYFLKDDAAGTPSRKAVPYTAKTMVLKLHHRCK